MTAQKPYIVLDNVQVRYSELVMGLVDAALEVERGEFVYLVGPTGSGKSTILKLLTREVTATAGRVLLNGNDVGLLPRREIPHLRRQIGWVPQDYALLPNKTVWENVAYAMRAIGKTKREVRKILPAVLEKVNIAHRIDAFPHQLSGGEQQRVAIARALINNPPIILADEPTGNLDPDQSLSIIHILEELNREGTTVLVATHDWMVIQKLRHRVVNLQKGVIDRGGQLVLV